MKKTIIGASLFFITVCLFSQNAFGGAWTVPRFRLWNEIYMKANFSGRDFDQNSHKIRKSNNAKSWSYEMEPKFEFGVTDWLNLLFSFTAIEAHYKEYDRPAAWGPYSVMNNGVKDVKYGGKVRLLKEPVVASAQIRFFQYTFYDNPVSGGEVTGQPMIGRGDDALEIRGLVGKTFTLPIYFEGSKLPFYIGAETGYRFRGRDVANDIPFFVEAGFWPYKWLLIKGEVDGYKAHAGTGITQSYAIWRAGCVFQIFGNSQLRDKNLFNLELQYGQTFWGKGGSADTNVSGSVVDAGHEIVIKVQHQF